MTGSTHVSPAVGGGSRASLGSLPQEIIRMIACKLKKKDIKSLRRTCKGINLWIVHYLQRPFLNSRFLYTEPSLQGLVEMTAGPIFTFGQEVTLIFGTARLADEWDGLDDVHSETFGSIDLTWDTRACRNHLALEKIQQEFLDSKKHIALLAQVFDNLKAKNVRATVGIFDNFLRNRKESNNKRHNRKGFGFDATYGGIRKRMWYLDVPGTLEDLFEALNRSSFVPDGLLLDIDNDPERYDPNYDANFGFRQALDHVLDPYLFNGGEMVHPDMKICLDIRHRYDYPGRGDIKIDSGPEHHTFALKDLTVDKWDVNEPFETNYGCLMRVVLKGFQNISLKRSKARPIALKEFLLHNRGELKHLRMEEVYLSPYSHDADDTHWAPNGVGFFTFLLDQFQLETLEVEDITSFEDDEHRVVVSGKQTMAGRDAVARGIQGIIRELQRQDRTNDVKTIEWKGFKEHDEFENDSEDEQLKGPDDDEEFKKIVVSEIKEKGALIGPPGAIAPLEIWDEEAYMAPYEYQDGDSDRSDFNSEVDDDDDDEEEGDGDNDEEEGEDEDEEEGEEDEEDTEEE